MGCFKRDLKGSLEGDIDIDVEVDVQMDSCFGCFKGALTSVGELINSIEAVVVLTLRILR